MTKKKLKDDEVKVLKGDHLTVTTYPNGKIDLAWDWDALTNAVVAATTNVSRNLIAETEAKVKKSRKKKVM